MAENLRRFKLKNIVLDNNIFLAPLAAVNCPAFRLLCKRYGAGLTYTQMIDAEEFAKDPFAGYDKYVDILAGEKPLAVQLIGSKADSMKAAAEKISEYASIIDINLGCAEPEMLAKKSGCFFMKHPEQMERIVSAVMGATNLPVTAKMRSGWDSESINAPAVAKMLEDMGISAVAVHPRTKKQSYTGKADWGMIKKVKEAVNIPVIGNGDVVDGYSAKRMFETTGCDAIMIGRAAIGNPMVFKEIDIALSEEMPFFAKPTIAGKKKIFLEFSDIYLNQQKRRQLSEFSQHAQWFFKGVPAVGRICEEIRKKDSFDSIIRFIKNI